MGIKKLKPTTPGQRFRVAPTFEEITKHKPEKSLLRPLKKSGGRNNQGRITAPHRGGGHKRRYRIIDFKREKHGVTAKVIGIEYDPNRSAYIALIQYQDGIKSYIIAPQGLKIDQSVQSGPESPPEIGNCLLLSEMPIGTIIHNLELQPGKGAVLVRSAGNYAQLLARSGKYATVKLPSGESRQILLTCYASIGIVSNTDHMNVRKGKAGRNRWLGRRPRTRGVAMNPIDHPMGGGEGKASGGHPRSKTSIYAKGAKTRNPKRYSNKLIIGKKKK